MTFTVWVGVLGVSVLAADWPAIHGNAEHTGVTAAERLTLPLSLAWVTQADQAPVPAFPKGMGAGGGKSAKGREAGKLAIVPDSLAQDYVYYPVIAGDRLYFGASTEEAVYCLDTAIGALWPAVGPFGRARLDRENRHSGALMMRTPAIVGVSGFRSRFARRE